MLDKTKDLMSVVSRQEQGVIPAWMASDALKRLNQDSPDTTRAESIIKKLNDSEKHPALAAKLKEARTEIEGFTQSNHRQEKQRSIKI